MTQDSIQIKRFIGEIVSHKTPKTAIVRVTSTKIHQKYHKRYTIAKKYAAHDEADAYQKGDRVEIVPCRPMSRTKRFIITKKIS